MKRITLLSIIFLVGFTFTFAKKPWPTAVAGIYKIANASVVPTAEFDSISEAIAWLNQSGPVTGDIVFEIASDLEFYNEVGLAKEMNGYKLTIRPDKDEQRTILFKKTTGKVLKAPFSYGNFYIGYKTGALQGALSSFPVQDSLISTNNVTIDGYALGGSTSRLRFTTIEASLNENSIFSIVGGCDNVIIKNCLFDLNNTSVAAQSYAIYLYTARNVTAPNNFDRAPSNIIIENNVINNLGGSQKLGAAGSAIGMGRVNASTAQTNNFVIRNNKIKITAVGVNLISTYNVNCDIINNEFSMIQGVSKFSSNGFVRLTSSSNSPGTINIVGNKVLEMSTLQTSSGTLYGVYISSGGTDVVNIYNNSFAGLNRGGNTAASVNVHLGYITAGSGNDRTKIYNNTFYLPALKATGTEGDFCAIRYESATATNWKANIINNIFATDDISKAIFISGNNAAGTVDYNAYCFYNQPYKGGIVKFTYNNGTTNITDTIRTIAQMKAHTTIYENNSVETPVAFVNTLSGDLTLDAALMTNEYCLPLKAPTLSEVVYDMFGKKRANLTMMGAQDVYGTPNAVRPIKQGVKILRTQTGIEIITDCAANIQLYSINGVMLDRAMSDGRYSHKLGTGVYVVRVNENTFKFIK